MHMQYCQVVIVRIKLEPVLGTTRKQRQIDEAEKSKNPAFQLKLQVNATRMKRNIIKRSVIKRSTNKSKVETIYLVVLSRRNIQLLRLLGVVVAFVATTCWEGNYFALLRNLCCISD